MELNNEILREWFHALSIDSACLNNHKQQEFKSKYGDIYNCLHSFYRIRGELNKDLSLISEIGLPIQWFTLTFDNKRDKSLIASKRKSATRFLNDLFLVYLMVEEFGEDTNRYHIHGFGVYRENKGFNDFRKWPCRCKIESLQNDKLKKKIKYLTKYAVKDLPRLRRSKSLCYLKKHAHLRLKHSFNQCYKCSVKHAVLSLELQRLYNEIRQSNKTFTKNTYELC